MATCDHRSVRYVVQLFLGSGDVLCKTDLRVPYPRSLRRFPLAALRLQIFHPVSLAVFRGVHAGPTPTREAKTVTKELPRSGVAWQVCEAGFQRRRPGREGEFLAIEELVNGGHTGGGDAGEHLDLPMQH